MRAAHLQLVHEALVKCDGLVQEPQVCLQMAGANLPGFSQQRGVEVFALRAAANQDPRISDLSAAMRGPLR